MLDADALGVEAVVDVGRLEGVEDAVLEGTADDVVDVADIADEPN